MMFASFDMGEKNFAFCVADVTDNTILPGPKKRGVPQPPIVNAFDIDVRSIECHDVVTKKGQSVIDSCIHVSKILDADPSLPLCSTILIEQQVMANVRAQRMAQHVWSYFHTKFPSKPVIMVPARLKTQHFLGKNTLGPKERKKWAIDKVLHIIDECSNHEEPVEIEPGCRVFINPTFKEKMDDLRKRDDVCDTILQLIAFLQSGVARKHLKTNGL